MKCVHCGAELPEGAKFCGKCAAPVPQAPVSPAAQPVSPAPVTSEMPLVPTDDRPVSPKKGSKRLMIILIAVIAAVVVLAAVLIPLLLNRAPAPAGEEKMGETAEREPVWVLVDSGVYEDPEDEISRIRYETYRDQDTDTRYTLVWAVGRDGDSAQPERVEGAYTPPAGYIPVRESAPSDVYTVGSPVGDEGDVSEKEEPATSTDPSGNDPAAPKGGELPNQNTGVVNPPPDINAANPADRFTGIWQIVSGEFPIDMIFNGLSNNMTSAKEGTLVHFHDGRHVEFRHETVNGFVYSATEDSIKFSSEYASTPTTYQFDTSSGLQRLTLITTRGKVVMVRWDPTKLKGIPEPEPEKQFYGITVQTCDETGRNANGFGEPVFTYTVITSRTPSFSESLAEDEYTVTATYNAVLGMWEYERKLEKSWISWAMKPGTYTDSLGNWIHIAQLDGNTVVIDESCMIKCDGEDISLAGITFRLKAAELFESYLGNSSSYVQESEPVGDHRITITLQTNFSSVTISYHSTKNYYDTYSISLKRTGD